MSIAPVANEDKGLILRRNTPDVIKQTRKSYADGNTKNVKIIPIRVFPLNEDAVVTTWSPLEVPKETLERLRGMITPDKPATWDEDRHLIEKFKLDHMDCEPERLYPDEPHAGFLGWLRSFFPASTAEQTDILKAFQHRNTEIRYGAVKYVQVNDLYSDKIADGLLILAKTDGQPEIRMSALWALTRIGGTEVFSEIQGIMKNDKDARVRNVALKVLKGD